MMQRILILCAMLLSFLALAASEPGYEDELYCPKRRCLKHKPTPPDWSGSRVDAHTCCDEKKGQSSPPHAWGALDGEDDRAALVGNGWHQEWCAEREGVCGKK